MKRSGLLSVPVLAVILVFCFATGSRAQDTSGGEAGPGKSPRAEEFDREALQKLKKLPPQQVEELDARLAEALTLFYDREYARALPIFREIAGTVETMDIMFWAASAAAGAGNADAAIENFKRMLEIDPSLYRVRLELATVYFRMGRYDDARAELRTVLEARPPEPVRNNIEKMLAAIDERTRRVFAGVRGSLGIQRDGNVSAGPDKEFITIPEGRGTIGPLTETQKGLSDWVTVGTAFGTFTYDYGDRGSWMWNTTGSFYQTHNFKYHQFDYTQLRVTTGPWWVGSRSILKLPAGYAYNMYEHEDLYHSYDFAPSYEYFFTPRFSLQGIYSYARETYAYSAVPADDRTGQDGVIRAWELNPNLYFNNRKDILSFYIGDEDSNTKSRVYTYDAINLGVAYFKLFELWNGEMEFYGRYRYTRREYATPAVLWPSAFLRTDERHNFYFVLSRNISKNLFASISYNFINNESNTELYDFEKDVWAFTVGFKF
jgi:tetratricopeptide (TPR) repeat protein